MSQQVEHTFFSRVPTQAAQEWSCEDAVRILDDIRRAVTRSPDDARKAASRLVHLLNCPAPQGVAARGGLAPWQKRKVERFMKEHLTESVRVEQLAHQVSLSASYFHHAFKETFGTSPHAHITKLRLESAQAMMLSTEEPLSQIAFACGFADQSHLCKIFRRELGEPPGLWRRRHRDEKNGEAVGRKPVSTRPAVESMRRLAA